MQLAKDDVGSIAAQDFGHSLLNAAQLVPVTEHEITGLDRLLFRITSGDAASFDGWVADSVLESKRLCLSRQGMTVLSPDGFDSGHLAVGFACAFEGGFKPRFVRRDCRQNDVYVASPERLLPIFGSALTGVAQVFGARCHSL